MANTRSKALLVLTSWNTASDDLTSQPTRTLVNDFCENIMKFYDVSKLFCTVLDVEVSEDQKKDAESVRVTLIPATRSKWADPDEDPPGIHWLFNHDKYYRQLKDLQNVKHVVSFSPKTKNAVAAIHESLFPRAMIHQLSVPTPPGVVFAFYAWSRDACGLTGYHRAIVLDFLTRKAEGGEHVKAYYSTVLDIEPSVDQIEDAEKCGVILIKAQKKKGVDEMPKLEWLVHHESHFPGLRKLQNIKYVVGYAPKTGWAAIDIREKLFPHAKLVLINHVCQEKNCLLVKDEFSELEQEMLQMASHADLLFSIGPYLYSYFKSAYRAVINGRKLYDIPHKEILPKPGKQYFDNERPKDEIEIDGPIIITYGQLNAEEALKRCDTKAAAIGSVANKHKDFGKKPLQWKIHGVCEQAYKSTKNFLVEKLQSSHTLLKPYKCNSADSLLQSIQQSDHCLPPSCYTDYSFEGLEAMAAGLPTTVQDDSHIAAMIDKHFEEHKDYCVVRNETENLSAKITENLTKNNVAVQQAKLLKEDLAKSEAVTKSLDKFASSLTNENGDWSLTLVNGQHQDHGQKFKWPRGLAFLRDKLVLCDRGSNIVQILNKDYTCDKVLGSFDGHFAKPFRPVSVAISRFNRYFILDDANKQVVVCDENGKIIQIITLRENIKEVWDIALIGDFALLTLSLISPNSRVRHKDKGHRLVKFTQNGECVALVGDRRSDHTLFKWPLSVVVNSKNVIMVYDSGNNCIKCFDSDLIFLHQFGKSDISGGNMGYIAVDEDDNVYVCNIRVDSIIKFRYDGEWICDLFKGDVSGPRYIAVLGDKIGVVEWNSDQIKVFSK